MTILASLLAQLLHIMLMAAAAPILAGSADWCEARLAGRRGPSIMLPWRDLVRLLHKQTIVAESSSAMTEFAPLVSAAAVAVAVCLVPSFARGMLMAPVDDVLVIGGLLALSRSAVALAAMDAGSAPAGQGASRTMLLTCVAEPVLLTVVFGVGLFAGTLNIDLIASLQQQGGGWRSGADIALASFVLLAVGDTVAIRGETLIEDLSGSDLVLVRATEMLRLLVWLNLICALFLPYGIVAADAGPLSWLTGVLCWLVRTALLLAGIVLMRTVCGHLRLPRVAGMLGLAALIALLAVVLLSSTAGLA